MGSKIETLADFYTRFRTLMLDTFLEKKPIMMTDDLPAPLLNQVGEIENRNSISAIDGYLAALEIGPIYPFIITLIFPKALLCGFIDFAYEVLAYSEYFHKKIGPGNRTLFGIVPWRETEARIEFEKCIVDLESEKAKPKNSLLQCRGNDVIYNGSLKTFMNKIVEKKYCEQFDLEFAETRIDQLIYLYKELRNRSIIVD